MNFGRYELDSVERRERQADRLNCVSLAVVMCADWTQTNRNIHLCPEGAYICQAAFHSALPRSPSLSIFQDYTNPVYLNDPTNKSHISEITTVCGTLL